MKSGISRNEVAAHSKNSREGNHSTGKSIMLKDAKINNGDLLIVEDMKDKEIDYLSD